MKFEQKDSQQLAAANEGRLRSEASTVLLKSQYFPLLVLIAQACDMMARGDDVYVLIGTTMKRDAFTFRVKAGDNSLAVYGVSLEEIAAKSTELQ